MRVVVGAALDGTKCFNSEGVVEIREGVVTSAEVALALDAASAVLLPPGSRIQHALGDFSVDGGAWARNPMGARGRELRARVHLITAPIEAVQELETAAKRAGLDIANLVLEPFTLATFAEASVSPQDEGQGLVVIDLGEPVTLMVVLVNGRVEHSAVLLSTPGSREPQGRTDLMEVFRSVRREIWKSGCASFLGGVTIISDDVIPQGTEEFGGKIFELPVAVRSARDVYGVQDLACAAVGSTARRLLWYGSRFENQEED